MYAIRSYYAFAYILATIANRSSAVDVEQILGRILRQPYTKDHKTPFLNMSYVITCSDDFRTTIDKVITGLNNAGFSKRDMRLGTDDTETAIITQDLVQTGTQSTFDEIPNKTEEADIPDIDASVLRDELAVVTTNTTTPSTSVTNMFETAISQSQEYNDVIDQNSRITSYNVCYTKLLREILQLSLLITVIASTVFSLRVKIKLFLISLCKPSNAHRNIPSSSARSFSERNLSGILSGGADFVESTINLLCQPSVLS